MKNGGLKKFIVSTLTAVILLNPLHLAAQDSSGVLDESVQDLYVVLGAGAAGAVLGLSTLSFADKPGDKLGNITIGGAIGIIVGVGIVVFSQATKSSSAISYASTKIDSAEAVESFARLDFSKQQIESNAWQTPHVGFNFTF